MLVAVEAEQSVIASFPLRAEGPRSSKDCSAFLQEVGCCSLVLQPDNQRSCLLPRVPSADPPGLHCCAVNSLYTVVGIEVLADLWLEGGAILSSTVKYSLPCNQVTLNRVLFITLNPCPWHLRCDPSAVLPCFVCLGLCSKDHLNPVPRSWPKALNLEACSSLDIIQSLLQLGLDHRVVILLCLGPACINNDCSVILVWQSWCCSLLPLNSCLWLLQTGS